MDYDEIVSAYADPEDWNTKPPGAYRDLSPVQLEDDWENLRRHAVTFFPEGKTHLALTGPQKLVAIAVCLGWPIPKIVAAARTSESTVKRTLKRPDVMVFMKEFQVRQGDGDPNSLLDSLAYQSIKYAGSLLNDPDPSDSMKRLKLDAAKWIVERRYGKSDQKLKVESVDMATVFKHMGASALVLSDDEEDDLFKK